VLPISWVRSARLATIAGSFAAGSITLSAKNHPFRGFYGTHSLVVICIRCALSTAIAVTFECRGTRFPEGLPIGLTSAFATDTAKIRGWESFYRKTVTKDAVPPLPDVIQRLAEFLELLLTAASKGDFRGDFRGHLIGRLAFSFLVRFDERRVKWQAHHEIGPVIIGLKYGRRRTIKPHRLQHLWNARARLSVKLR
jgi:hypothetical protein